MHLYNLGVMVQFLRRIYQLTRIQLNKVLLLLQGFIKVATLYNIIFYIKVKTKL